MPEPSNHSKTVKVFRLTIQYGGDEYVVAPLEPKPEIAILMPDED